VLRAPRWALALVALATLTVAGAGIAIAVIVSSGGTSNSPASRSPSAGAAALTAFVAALRAPTAQGGQVVEQEMKPSIADLSSGQIDGPTMESRARSWQIAFARVRQRVDAIAVPAGLQTARQLFDSAIDGYARVAAILLQAGAAAPDGRGALLDAAVAAGRRADALYDQASAQVQAALRAAGLPVDPNLPDPTPTPR
jgi:hypothetical protein